MLFSATFTLKMLNEMNTASSFYHIRTRTHTLSLSMLFMILDIIRHYMENNWQLMCHLY